MKKINKDFQAALENEVVSMAQSQDRYALPHVKYSYLIIFSSLNFTDLQLGINGFWVTHVSARIGNKLYLFNVNS